MDLLIKRSWRVTVLNNQRLTYNEELFKVRIENNANNI